jgi:Kef-type K+ transport system membrane component KefB
MSNLEYFVHTALAMVVIITVARSVGSFMVFIKQPRVVGEMIAGVLLGPTLFSSLFPAASSYLFKDTQPFIYMLGNFGLCFYMFLVGMEIDFTKVTAQVRKQAAVLSIIATIIPFAVGCFSAWLFFDKLCLPGIKLNTFMFFMGTAFSIMAFPMLARILDEKKMIRTTIGSLSMLSSSIQDVVTWVLLAFITAIASTGNLIDGFITLGGALIFIALARFVFKPFLASIGQKVETENSMSQNQFAIILVMILISAIITDKIGLYCVFGGFILGLVMPRGPVFQNKLTTKLQDVAVIFLLPLFFSFSGLKTNFLVLSSADLIIPSLVILSLSILGKYLPVLLSMKAIGFSWRESSAIGALINARGLMELIIANIGLEYKIIDVRTYSILVLIAVITTLSAMPIYTASIGNRTIS